jgi:hypothetical protein
MPPSGAFPVITPAPPLPPVSRSTARTARAPGYRSRVAARCPVHWSPFPACSAAPDQKQDSKEPQCSPLCLNPVHRCLRCESISSGAGADQSKRRTPAWLLRSGRLSLLLRTRKRSERNRRLGGPGRRRRDRVVSTFLGGAVPLAPSPRRKASSSPFLRPQSAVEARA